MFTFAKRRFRVGDVLGRRLDRAIVAASFECLAERGSRVVWACKSRFEGDAFVGVGPTCLALG